MSGVALATSQQSHLLDWSVGSQHGNFATKSRANRITQWWQIIVWNECAMCHVSKPRSRDFNEVINCFGDSFTLYLSILYLYMRNGREREKEKKHFYDDRTPATNMRNDIKSTNKVTAWHIHMDPVFDISIPNTQVERWRGGGGVSASNRSSWRMSRAATSPDHFMTFRHCFLRFLATRFLSINNKS